MIGSLLLNVRQVITYARVISIADSVQVALKMFLKNAAIKAVERQVQLLQACRQSRHLCRVYGVTTLDQRACVVLDFHPHNLATELMFVSGK